MKPDSGTGKIPVGGQLRTLGQEQRQKQRDQLRSRCPELSSLCCAAGSHQLAALHMVVYMYVSVLSFNSSPTLLCDDLEGWDGCGEREGIYVYLQLIHVVYSRKYTT